MKEVIEYLEKQMEYHFEEETKALNDGDFDTMKFHNDMFWEAEELLRQVKNLKNEGDK